MARRRDDPEERRPTRASFVERLRNWEDHASWRAFLADYALLIHRAAVRSGLEPHEADEVVQETAISVAKKMPDFVYDPTRCSFEGWVRRIARLRIQDQLRKRSEEDPGPVPDEGTGTGTGFTDAVHRIPAGVDGGPGDGHFENDWQRSLLDAAMDRLRLKVAPEHFQIFQMNVVHEMPATEVAATLDVSLVNVYVVRHRLTHMLRREVERLRTRMPGGGSS